MTATASPLIGQAPPSPAGPTTEGASGLKPVPRVDLPRPLQSLRFSMRQKNYVFAGARAHGDVFLMRGTIPGPGVAITSHPDHVRSIFTAKPELVPTLTSESPLAAIVGPNAVLTTQGARHLKQRKLLLPPFHGASIAKYQEVIEQATARELDRWHVGETIDMSEAMQALTLEVILSGVFGVGRKPTRKEKVLKVAISRILKMSTTPFAKIGELINIGRTEPVGGLALVLNAFDKTVYDVITERRAAMTDGEERVDVLSLLLAATDEDGNPITDHELRDQLVSLLLAGHETTANTVAWTYERLTRTQKAYDDLRDAVRSGDAEQSERVTEWVNNESMRARPVIPVVGRRLAVDWQLGEYFVPAGTGVALSILLVHHREDLYPRASEFLPERWDGVKPGTYSWLPFGGGTRRCLGAALAMAELRHVTAEIARRFDLEADRPEAELVQHRNVTMIPRRGGRVIVKRKLS